MTIHQTPGKVVVDIHLSAGEIDLRTDDVETTTVELESLTGESGEAAIAASEQDCRERDGGYTVRIRVPRKTEKRRFFGRDPEVRVSVVAPHGTRLDSETASADVTVSGRPGGLDVKTASGDVHAGAVEGPVEVKTMSGDVDLGAVAGRLDVKTMSGDQTVESVAGDARMHTMSGDVSVGANGGSADASTMSGDVHLDSVERGEIDVRSASGDITIGVVRGTRVWMDVQTSSGDADSELDHSDGDGTGDAATAQVRLRAHSASGDIRIRRSSRPAAAAGRA